MDAHDYVHRVLKSQADDLLIGRFIQKLSPGRLKFPRHLDPTGVDLLFRAEQQSTFEGEGTHGLFLVRASEWTINRRGERCSRARLPSLPDHFVGLHRDNGRSLNRPTCTSPWCGLPSGSIHFYGSIPSRASARPGLAGARIKVYATHRSPPIHTFIPTKPPINVLVSSW